MTSSYYPIHEKPDFVADAYAQKIEKALIAGDKNAVCKLLVGINNAQRQKLRHPYHHRFGKDLDEALQKKFSGDNLILIKALMLTPLQYDIQQLEQCTKGWGTDENTLIEIICSRTPDQLKTIVAHYDKDKKHPRKPLSTVVDKDTSGEFRMLLVNLVNGSKDPGYATDDAQARDDAVRLFADGRGKFKGGKDGSHFLNILAKRNIYQLRKVFAEFGKLSGQNITKAIEQEFSGDLKNAYLAVAKVSVNKQAFFAQQLFKSMHGAGTNENDLVRVLVSRSEVDLHLIREEFKSVYTKTLEDFIRGDTADNEIFRDALLAICAGNQ